MPNQPNDRCRRSPKAHWPASWTFVGRFPDQPPHRGNRAASLTWAELNRLPAGASARNLNAH
ncbi:hypothetical protein HCB17_16415 [Salinispora arenicola]|uniref:DNA repair protein n=1 Tax=Salinispora arenicola TaxID=168697 RepID=A0ABQ4JNQ9_SALAC|nr:hypothetical protein [Salinispora arenicola]NIL56360.1 hypothetical protein [Salinispora arenicola]NIL62441.1 hypothetical protein [Salinispora arenicola]GIM83259.1 hypothetical protein Sar04_11330 [Salinispora arenicola]